MDCHGEAFREATASGTVVLSRLESGASRIIATAPSVRFVLQGEEVYRIAGRTWRLRAGEFMLVESGCKADVRTSRGTETIGLCVYFPAIEDALSGAGDLAQPVIAGGSADPLANLLRNYADAFVRKSPGSEVLADRLRNEIASASVSFLRRFDAKRDRLWHARPSARTEIVQRLERARALIHDSKDRAMTLDELASEAALSRFHLTRTFHQVYGYPPLTYHRKLRLNGAAAKLLDGSASATELSEQLGYANLSAFSRAFSSEFGIPPSRF
jgi:AraC-like DNA-binding protein